MSSALERTKKEIPENNGAWIKSLGRLINLLIPQTLISRWREGTDSISEQICHLILYS
jgi:hypothetical protein